MNIEIKRNSPYDSKTDDLKWDLHANSLYRSMILSFSAGLCCIAIYWYSALSVFESIGSILIILSVISLFNLFGSRNNFKSRHEKAKHTIPASNNEVTISLQNASFKYENFEIKQEFKWSVFSYYKYVDGILLLLTGDSYLSSYAIYKDELTDQEFLELLNFVKAVFPEKK